MKKIRRYNPVIYPVKLWIVGGWSEKELKAKFRSDWVIEWKRSEYMAMSVINKPVIERRSRYLGFVLIVGDNYDGKNRVRYICHEASHICDFIWEHLGCDSVDGEANAYLMGWVGECINKFLEGYE